MKKIKDAAVLISWLDFYNGIELKRLKYVDRVVYVGTYRTKHFTYTDEFEIERHTYDNNTDDVELIDEFVREQLAKKLYKQINPKDTAK